MNADLSVAPELAQFAQRRPADPVVSTLGTHADELTRLAGTPQRWWDRVRFDPAAPLRIPLEAAPPGVSLPAAETWLLVLPPRRAVECDCRLATLVAGEAAEDGRPLRPGRTLVHGDRAARHVIRATDAGYAVSLHTSRNHPLG